MSMVKEGLPETSRTLSSGRYELRAYKGLMLAWHEADLADVAKGLSAKVFGMDREEVAKEVAFNMRNGGSIVIATLKDTQEAIGYSTQRVLEPTIEGYSVRVLVTTTALVLPDYQGEGLGTTIKQYAFSTHDAPDIIGGRTRKAEVVRNYYKSDLVKEGGLYPFDKLYSQSRTMQEVLRYVASQMRPKFAVDETTGLIKGVYKEEFESYDPKKASDEVKAIHAQMTNEFGLNPEAGDAIIMLGIRRGWTRFRE